LSWLLSLAAFSVSFMAWRLAAKAFRLGHRPIVRVVTVFASPQAFVHHPGSRHQDDEPDTLELNEVVLKNISPSPAITVLAFDPAIELAAVRGDSPWTFRMGSRRWRPLRHRVQLFVFPVAEAPESRLTRAAASCCARWR
jgi:hypothetical protein